jgi:hypothetical protein
MLDTLLIQLFGRAVTDRLTRAGFDTTEAIARTNAGELADEAGIAPALARRIIAVAAESGPPTENESSTELEADLHEAAPATQLADRHVRRPFKRPSSNLTGQANPSEVATPAPTEPVLTPPAAMQPTAKPPATTKPATAPVTTPVPTKPATTKPAPGQPAVAEAAVRPVPPSTGTGAPLAGSPASGQSGLPQARFDGVAFIDDSGLISSLGAAFGHGNPSGLSISVAEEILDAPPPEEQAPEARQPPVRTPLAVDPEQPIVKDSFWSFGQWPPARPETRGKAESPEEPTLDRAGESTRYGDRPRTGLIVPRRRILDDH